jgi:hypothetical protein
MVVGDVVADDVADDVAVANVTWRCKILDTRYIVKRNLSHLLDTVYRLIVFTTLEFFC